MPATYEWSESNGAGETVQDNIANLNFGSNDSYEIVPATYPVIASENSFSKYIRAKFSSTFTEISNMKFWKSAGAYVTGEDIVAQANVVYATPSATATGDSTIPVIVGSALSVQSAAGTGTITAPGYTKYIRLQLQTTGSTPSGSVNQKTFTFQYDEV